MLVKPKFKQKSFLILLAVPVIIITSILVVLGSLHSVRKVTDNADQLVTLQIPELRTISELQSVLNRQLIILHGYYATTDAPDAFEEKRLDESFKSNLKTLVDIGQHAADGKLLVSYVENYKKSAENFHNEMQKGRGRDWDILREHLAEASAYAQQANTELTDWNQKVRNRLAQGSSQTQKEVENLNKIQITFNIAMVLVAGLLLIIIYFRMRDQGKLFHSAHFEPLTDLPNRRSLQLWSERLVDQHNSTNPFYVAWLTLDRLGLISGTYGHIQGDALINKFSRSLEKILDYCQVDIYLFSIGSSNWVMVIKDAEDDNLIKQIIAQIEKLTSKPFNLEERDYNISCSIGISKTLTHEKDIQVLLRNADMARRSVLDDGGNNHRFYEPEMTDSAEKLLSVENDLRNALEKEEFELYYQPKLSKQGEQILSAEALIRWHSNGKIISPGIFIPVAEKTGLVNPIGDWVLRQACTQWVEWQRAGYAVPSVAVNISAQQFQLKSFINTVKAVVAETGIPPEKLELEITEEAASARPDLVVSVMDDLKEIGVSLAIDDFGTGYSSLAYLKRFPIDVIKIDRAFISQLHIS
ncbi:MAG: EAL domain-containing protein, partial [Gammaproteobacteria bacterium]|nr:EAL domain-containing protein [Gammaproteobacteria bacterium]